MKSKTAYILLIALMTLSSACIAENSSAFHPPQTKAERTLDSILAKDHQGDSDMRGYLIQYTQRDKSKDASYTPLFTDGFVKAVSVFEKHLVDTQCDGKYTPADSLAIACFGAKKRGRQRINNIKKYRLISI